MEMTPEQIEELAGYRGAMPCPADFEEFWRARVAEADAVAPRPQIVPAEIPPFATCEFHDLWFTGIAGERLHAKYLRPASARPVPLVMQFHGYPGSSRSWFEQASFCGMGMAVIALDCPGQGGASQDVGGYPGPTVSGHVVAGAVGAPDDLYYVRLHQDIRILMRLAAALPGIDPARVYVNGASQGGGLGIGACALSPEIVRRAAILYPFLSDFRMVWELDADEIAYEGLRYLSRWYDPRGERMAEWMGALAYVDAKNLASLVRCEVLFGTGLADGVCPPITQCAVYNGLSCPKERVLYPGFGHEEIQAFDDRLIAFFTEGE